MVGDDVVGDPDGDFDTVGDPDGDLDGDDDGDFDLVGDPDGDLDGDDDGAFVVEVLPLHSTSLQQKYFVNDKDAQMQKKHTK